MKRLIRILIVLILLMGLMQNATALASPASSLYDLLLEQLPGGDYQVASFEGNWIFADDFELTDKITIGQIDFWSSVQGPVEINIKFYANNVDDSGYNKPVGDPLFTTITMTSTGVAEDSSICSKAYCTYRHSLILGDSVLLNASHYWVSIYGSSGSDFVLSYEDSANVGVNLAAHWWNGDWYNNSQLNLALRIFGALYVDQTLPVVNVPSEIIVPATDASGAVVTFSASATDDVDGTLTPTCVPSSGSTFPIGTNTVTCSATDAAGNTGSAQFTVTVEGITIGPDLPSAEYTKQYSQQLTAEGGTAPYTFSLSNGTLPSGITLSSSGLLSGLPQGTGALPGTYPITIQVVDGNSITASRAYDFVVIKGTPTMDVLTSIPIYWHGLFNLGANVSVVTGPGSGIFLSGTVSFSVDGDPITECQNVPYVNGYYFCEGVTSVQLEVGSHTVSGTYTPSTDLTDYYNSANDSSDFTVDPIYFNIAGTLFRDQNENEVWEGGEIGLGTAWTINLDQSCDGTVEKTTTLDYWSSYGFNEITAGYDYCISADEEPGFQRTTELPRTFLTENSFSMNIGYYYPNIILTPIELSSVQLGQPINQQIIASGGEGPYTYKISWGTLPDGLSFSETGLLSGTPTAAGSTTVEIEAKDVNQAVGKKYYRILVTTDGVFSFTSSSNPSLLGDPVTFTISACGSATDPSYGPIPPIGAVTFYIDGNLNEDCSYLDLNQNIEDIGDYPVTCLLSTLAEGSHDITASFMPYSDVYNIPTLELIQVVQVVQENLIFLPLILR